MWTAEQVKAIMDEYRRSCAEMDEFDDNYLELAGWVEQSMTFGNTVFRMWQRTINGSVITTTKNDAITIQESLDYLNEE